MFPRYLQYLLTDFRQTFVTGASWDTDDLITFLGQKLKVQGHTIAAEAHSTRRYRRVQLFLVTTSFFPVIFPLTDLVSVSTLSTQLILLSFQALNSPDGSDVPLKIYSLTVTHPLKYPTLALTLTHSRTEKLMMQLTVVLDRK